MRLAEEEGIQPSVALTDSRQFSGLVTLATRPLLHIQNLERRCGIEPRTPRLHLGRSPLAVAVRGTSGVIRTLNRGFGARLTIGNRANGAPGWISNQHSTAFEAVVYRLDYGRMVGSVGFEPTLDTV